MKNVFSKPSIVVLIDVGVDWKGGERTSFRNGPESVGHAKWVKKSGRERAFKTDKQKTHPCPLLPHPLVVAITLHIHVYIYLGAFSSDDCYRHMWVTTDMFNTIKKGVKHMSYVKKLSTFLPRNLYGMHYCDQLKKASVQVSRKANLINIKN